jgi:hypothetical protein
VGFGRNGRSPDEIPPEELADIRRREREAYNGRKKRQAIKNAKAIEETLQVHLGRKLTKQETMSIESDERRLAFLDFFHRYNGNISAACCETGITRETFNRWLNGYPEFAEQITEVNEAMLDLAEQQLLKNIASGKEQSLFFLLCNKGKHRGWQDVRKLQAPKLNAININVNYADKTSKVADSVTVTAIEANDKTQGKN